MVRSFEDTPILARCISAMCLLSLLLFCCPAASPARADVPSDIPATVFADSFVRMPGKPSLFDRTVAVPASVHGPFTLVVRNSSPDGTNRVSSATVKLDGIKIAGPRDFNQQVEYISKEVSIEDGSHLTVDIKSSPNSVLQISITGFINHDQLLDVTTTDVDSDGAALELPGIATLTVPPLATTVASVEFATVKSAYMDYVRSTSSTDFLPFTEVPQLWIKSSTRFEHPVSLQVHVPDLATVVPAGRVPVFEVLLPDMGAEELLTDVISIGGVVCGADLLCVLLDPGWFTQINPLDPLDPVIWIQAGTAKEPALHILAASNITPTETTVNLETGGTMQLSADLKLDANIQTYLTHKPLASVHVDSAFKIRTFDEGTPEEVTRAHLGVDLTATKGTEVYAAGSGTACFHSQGDTGYGWWVQIQHGSRLETRYAHLSEVTRKNADGTFSSATIGACWSVKGGDPVGESGGAKGEKGAGTSTGAHLHYEVRVDNRPIDPEPILRNNLDSYLTDLKYLVEVRQDGNLTAYPTPVDLPKSVTFNQPGDFRVSLLAGSFRLGGYFNLQNWRVHVGDNPEPGGIFFDGSPGIEPPPLLLGGYTMTPFDYDGDSDTASIPVPGGGMLSFNKTMELSYATRIWGGWTPGYEGFVFVQPTEYPTPDLELMLPTSTKAFYFYVTTNDCGTFTVSATAQNGTSSGPITLGPNCPICPGPDCRSSARYFGFFSKGSDSIEKITLHSPATYNGLIVGQFGIYVAR